jgi:hypothetical protein
MSLVKAMLYLYTVSFLSKSPRVSAFRLKPRFVSGLLPWHAGGDLWIRRQAFNHNALGGVFYPESGFRESKYRKYFSSMSATTTDDSIVDAPTDATASPLKKVKVALVLGYVGTGYHGLQMTSTANQAVRTVEHDLEEALYKIGCISESNHKFLGKIGWSRSSRTDKGVHAARIIVGAKLLVDKSTITEDNRLPHLVSRINAHLPDGIRVFSACKVNAGFNARKVCKWRYV